MVVVLARTVQGLQGKPCIELEHHPAPKKVIACTRSFGHPGTRLFHLKEAVTDFTSRAAEKDRKQHRRTSQVLVFIRTSPFRLDWKFVTVFSEIRSYSQLTKNTELPIPNTTDRRRSKVWIIESENRRAPFYLSLAPNLPVVRVCEISGIKAETE